MRMRHTAKTDSLMSGDRRQVTHSLSGHYRQRIKDAVASGIPDLRSESDVVQDAIWLWFHEYDLLIEKGLIPNGSTPRAGTRKTGHPVHADPEDVEQAPQRVEVGSPAQASESRAG